MDYTQKYNFYVSVIESHLPQIFSEVFNLKSTVADAAKFSLFSGGKRVRAVLCLAVCDMLGEDINKAVHYAAAVEMLHCYSLIHDDLPCMDNAQMRRGKPACHVKYSEATALLAGDALLTAAFETIAQNELSHKQNCKAVLCLANAAGTNGMIYGQELDLYYEKNAANENELFNIHKNKTGKLICAAANLGAIAANAKQNKQDIINKYSATIGLVFQIIDDVLDATSNSEIMGKPTKSDEINEKTTFTKLFGVEESIQMAQKLTENACDLLDENFKDKANFLNELARNLIVRNN